MEYELYHWGIKGMKWGIRRFQNKDGSLTPAGRKRYEDRGGSSGGGKIKSKGSKPKATRDMSDDELRAKINRLTLEKTALDLERQISALSPQKAAKGQGFIQKVGKEVVGPALMSAGKTQLTNFLNDRLSKALGLNVKDEMSTLKKTVDELNLKKQKQELDKYFKGDSDPDAGLKSEVLRRSLEKQKRELDKYFDNENRQDQENTIKKGMKDEKSIDSSSGTKQSESTKSSSSSSSSSKTESTETEQKVTVSNSNARSVHAIYQSMTKGQNWIVDNLYSSGYRMTSVSQLERIDSKISGQISNGKAFVSTIGDYKMRSLEDIEKYN